MHILTHFRALAAVAVLGVVAPAWADTPTGPVILTVTDGAEAQAQFDLDMLDALDQRVTTTETPWYEGPQEFSGPLIADVMAQTGMDGSELNLVALNDYAAAMPWSDIVDFPVILATRLNGETMAVRDKGPLFVIYPFDEHPELKNEVYFSRSVWQVKAIEVRP
ncbi:MAG: hypothetical protein HLUCCA05_02390 [Roseibaca calidilacus]|uniref:Oxidoreductase molybdopterin-binding domain-containing protein n=1 Tax=Roseibaca calidilacus TaxID=1666912 RepID=A0A0P7WC69_9RHOB|nr:hypothetical protein [Roseibaca calidilacus]KPP95525.1 MAG: hypothetical protein HLUCCA05_02390 [Roseibaca calidilacus]CUX82147.1 hypothetical protein Ga0058931_2195 [Roseibaca calidilacus]